MPTFKSVFMFLLVGIMIAVSQPLPAQFLTIARKIKSMKSDGKDVATVIIDAGAFKVFKAVTDTLTSDPKCEILQRDNTKKFVEFTHDAFSLSLQVDSLAAGLSQITVLAQHSENSQQKTTDVAASVILSVCHKMSIHCTLKEPDATGQH